MVLILMAFMLIAPFTTNCGWQSINVQYFKDHQVFWLPMQQLPSTFGKPSVWVNSWFIRLFTDHYFFYKSFQIIWVLAAFFSFNGFLKLYVNPLTRYLGLWLFMVFGLSSNIYTLISVEAYYSGVIFIMLYLLARHAISQKPQWLYFAALTAAIAGPIHPNCIVASFLLILYGVVLLRQSNQMVWHLLPGGLIIIASYFFIVSHNIPIQELWNILRKGASDKMHNLPFYYEHLRYKHFLTLHPQLSGILLTGVACVILMIRAYRKQQFSINLPGPVKTLIIGMPVIIFFYLLMINVKWSHYLSLQFPFLIIALLFALQKLELDSPKVLRLLNFIVALFVLNLLVFRFPQNEEFLTLAGLPAKRIELLNEVNRITQNKAVLAPTQTFFLFHGSADYRPTQQMIYNNVKDPIEYVVIDLSDRLINEDYVEERLGIALSYELWFTYNKGNYNLYRVTGPDNDR